MKRLSLLIFLSLALVLHSSAQESIAAENVPWSSRTAIYGSTGVFPIYGIALLNAEFALSTERPGFFSSTWFRVAWGKWLSWGDEGNNFTLGASMLSGKRKNHLEAGIGGTLYTEFNSDQKLLPALNIGYRFQKPMGGFVFRTGMGIPESIYFGLGYSF